MQWFVLELFLLYIHKFSCHPTLLKHKGVLERVPYGVYVWNIWSWEYMYMRS